ncbi:MAG TPA: 50S ribosomal protein L3 [Pirellulales bacterium]
MSQGLIGQKIGMTQIFEEDGTAVPVTVLQLGPCPILQLRTKDRDGYEAVQIGYGQKPRRLASRSVRGHVAKLESKRTKNRAAAGVEAPPKANCEPPKVVKEFRIPVAGKEVGQVVKVDLFNGVKFVDVTGTSKGRGFAGVMVRHNFHGQRATHGVKKVHRAGGSNGQNTFPARVFKGKKMAGQHGNVQRTQRNLKVVRVDLENNLLLIRGAVPGPNGGFITVRPTNMV